MKKNIFLIISFLFVNTFAGGLNFGKYSGEFLNIGVGGRALGLGSAFVGMKGEVISAYFNPASLTNISYPQGSLMYDSKFAGLVNYNYFGAALPYREDMTFALSIMRLGVDGIPDTRNALVDQNGNGILDPGEQLDYAKITEFNYSDWAFYFSFAKKINANLSIGGNVKMIYKSLGDFNAYGLGFDIAAWYNPYENFYVGANIQDVTTTLLAWSTGTNELIAPKLKIGAAYEWFALSGKITPVVDFDVYFENRKFASLFNVGPVSFDLHAGLEYSFKDMVSVRVGFNEVKQLTLGAGIQLPKLNIDYSFVKFDGSGDLGNTHRISLMITLDEDKYKR